MEQFFLSDHDFIYSKLNNYSSLGELFICKNCGCKFYTWNYETGLLFKHDGKRIIDNHGYFYYDPIILLCNELIIKDIIE